MGRRVSGPHAGVVTPNDVAVPDMGRRGEREQVRAGPVAKTRSVFGTRWSSQEITFIKR